MTDADLDIDDSLQLLSNERRRLATQYAAQLPADEVADISAITNYVIDRLEDSEACRTTQYKRVYIAMSQSHLGKLVDAGVLVEANQPGKFMRGPAAEPLADMLANLEEMVE